MKKATERYLDKLKQPIDFWENNCISIIVHETHRSDENLSFCFFEDKTVKIYLNEECSTLTKGDAIALIAELKRNFNL